MNISRTPKMPSGSLIFPVIFLSAAICLLASLVLPLAFVQDAYQISQCRQRAREIAGVCQSAHSAGLDLVQEGSLETTIRSVVRGGRVENKTFFVPGMTEDDIPQVARHLSISSGQLSYKSTIVP